MDLKIGLLDTPQGLEIELPAETDSAALKSDLDGAIGGDGTIWLTDKDGNQFGVKASKVAWVKVGVSSGERKIGFGV